MKWASGRAFTPNLQLHVSVYQIYVMPGLALRRLLLLVYSNCGVYSIFVYRNPREIPGINLKLLLDYKIINHGYGLKRIGGRMDGK